VQQNDKVVLIYATAPTLELADLIAARLVDQGLAACVNLIPGMTAIYVWQGQRQRDSEVAMIIKTRASLADHAIAAARDLHPYQNPAFVVLPTAGGSQTFLDWIMAQAAGQRS